MSKLKVKPSISTADKLNFLAELLSMDNLTTIKIGFCTIMKVDKNTFTISEIDELEFSQLLENKESLDEHNIQKY